MYQNTMDGCIDVPTHPPPLRTVESNDGKCDDTEFQEVQPPSDTICTSPTHLHFSTLHSDGWQQSPAYGRASPYEASATIDMEKQPGVDGVSTLGLQATAETYADPNTFTTHVLENSHCLTGTHRNTPDDHMEVHHDADFSDTVSEAGAPNDDMQVDADPMQMIVTIRVPAIGATCPISMDTIDNSEVDGFNGFAIHPAHPERTEVVLPCNHSFSACYLVVSWLTSPMRCPLCRKGVDMTLNPECLSGKWPQIARDHADRITEMDRTEQLSNDHEEALRHGLNNTTNIQLYMCLYVIGRDGCVRSSVVQFSHQTSQMPTSPYERLVLNVSRAHVRSVSGLVRQADCVALSMVVFARCEGDGVELVEVNPINHTK